MNKYPIQRSWQRPTIGRFFANVRTFFATLFSIPGDYLRLFRRWRHGPVFVPPPRPAGYDHGQYALLVQRERKEHEYRYLVEAVDRQNFREKITAKWNLCFALSPPVAFLGLFPAAIYYYILETEYPYILARLDPINAVLRFLFQ